MNDHYIVSLPEDLCCWVHLAECSLACKLNHGMSPVSFQQVTINRCTLWDIVVTVYTNSFNIKNFYLRFTQFIYIYCVYLWTNKDDFPIHDSIIGFSTETESVYCAVRAECLNINQVNPRLSTRRTVFDSMSAYVSFVVHEVALGDLQEERTIWKWILEETGWNEVQGGRLT